MKKGKTFFWMMFILILVAAILAITFFGLFGKKNTNELAESVNEYSTSGYLAEDGKSYTKIKTYYNGLQTSDFSENELKELNNFRQTYKAFISIATFFNRQAYFMTYSKTYKDNRKVVEKALKNANNAAKELVSLIEDAQRVAGTESYWAHKAWTSMRTTTKTLVTNTIDAFNTFAKIYQKSVVSNLLNNDYSDVVFMCMKKLSANLVDGFENTEGVGDKLNTFADIYFTKECEKEIIKYSYLDNESGSTTRATILELKEYGEAGRIDECSLYANFIVHMPV